MFSVHDGCVEIIETHSCETLQSASATTLRTLLPSIEITRLAGLLMNALGSFRVPFLIPTSVVPVLQLWDTPSRKMTGGSASGQKSINNDVLIRALQGLRPGLKLLEPDQAHLLAALLHLIRVTAPVELSNLLKIAGPAIFSTADNLKHLELYAPDALHLCAPHLENMLKDVYIERQQQPPPSTSNSTPPTTSTSATRRRRPPPTIPPPPLPPAPSPQLHSKSSVDSPVSTPPPPPPNSTPPPPPAATDSPETPPAPPYTPSFYLAHRNCHNRHHPRLGSAGGGEEGAGGGGGSWEGGV